MNILFLTEDFPPMPGGIATFLSELCKGLTERGHEVRVLVHEMPGFVSYDRKQPYPVIRYPVAGRLSSLRIGYQILKQIIKKKPDIIFLGHVFSTRGLAVLLIKWLFWIPYVILIHGGHLPLSRVSKINRLFVFLLLRHANLLLANSKFTRTLLAEQGIPEEKIRVLHPGVDIDYFSPSSSRYNKGIEIIKKTYCDLNTILIVNVARLFPKKNHIRLIIAMAEIIKRGKPVKCVIAGDGPERERLERLIQSLGLSNQICLVGTLDRKQVRDLFRSADVVTLPSTLIDGHHESFGIVAIEAASCGKPVIVGSIGGQTDTVVHEKTGFVIDGDDTHAIDEAIEKLIEDRELSKKFGEAGRKRAVKGFSWEKIAVKAEKMLESLI